MSLIIKGIDMPKSCGGCEFNYCLEGGSYEWWECVILHDDINQFDTRRTDCPLVEIDDTTISKPRDSNGRFSSGVLDEWADIPSLDGEIWKPIKGYEDRYKVSNMGRVRSRTKILSQGGRVYKHVTLNNGDISHRSTRTVHTLVANAFIPNPEGLLYVNHKDYDTHNNRAENLEWCTASYNVRYSLERRKRNAPTILEAEE